MYATYNIGKNDRGLKYCAQTQNQSPSHEGNSTTDSQPAADVTPIDPNVFTNLFNILSQRRHAIEDSVSSVASSCANNSVFISVADLDKTIEEMNIPNVQKQALSMMVSSVIGDVINKSQILLSTTQGGSSSQQHELNVHGLVINDHYSSEEENH